HGAQTGKSLLMSNIRCNTSTNVFSCVQTAPEQLLFKAIREVGKALSPLPSSTDPWQPVVDGTFLTDFPTKLLAQGKYAKVPIIIGFTTDEVSYVIPTNLNISTDAQLAAVAQSVLPFVPIPI